MSAHNFEEETHVHTPDEKFALEDALRQKNIDWFKAYNNDPTSIRTQHSLHAVDKVGEHLARVHNLFPVDESRVSISGIAKTIVGRIFRHKS